MGLFSRIINNMTSDEFVDKLNSMNSVALGGGTPVYVRHEPGGSNNSNTYRCNSCGTEFTITEDTNRCSIGPDRTCPADVIRIG